MFTSIIYVNNIQSEISSNEDANSIQSETPSDENVVREFINEDAVLIQDLSLKNMFDEDGNVLVNDFDGKKGDNISELIEANRVD